MERTRWTDERLDEKMHAVDSTVERIWVTLDGLREDLREDRHAHAVAFAAMNARLDQIQDRLVQVAFGLVVALIGALAALIIALAA